MGNIKREPSSINVKSLGGVASPNNNGVQVVAGIKGKKIKVFDAGYEAIPTGLHYFYFGTSSTSTTKRFCSSTGGRLLHQTFVQPRVGDDGDGLWVFSAVSETNMPFDIGYVQE